MTLKRRPARLKARWTAGGRQACWCPNEVGLGIVPEGALARRFRDDAGLLHQRLAARADHVVLVAAGLPLILKQGPKPDTRP